MLVNDTEEMEKGNLSQLQGTFPEGLEKNHTNLHQIVSQCDSLTQKLGVPNIIMKHCNIQHLSTVH
jgi:hypothetical protein